MVSRGTSFAVGNLPHQLEILVALLALVCGCHHHARSNDASGKSGGAPAPHVSTRGTPAGVGAAGGGLVAESPPPSQAQVAGATAPPPPAKRSVGARITETLVDQGVRAGAAVADSQVQNGVNVESSSSSSSGQKTMTINGCTYTDSPSGSLGNNCGARSSCPGGYICDLIQSTNSGWCVPANQRCH